MQSDPHLRATAYDLAPGPSFSPVRLLPCRVRMGAQATASAPPVGGTKRGQSGAEGKLTSGVGSRRSGGRIGRSRASRTECLHVGRTVQWTDADDEDDWLADVR
jgi:hypothetical protein